MRVKKIAKEIYDWTETCGWHNKKPLEYIALIASEVGECANECRGDEPTPALGEELADVILRTLDFALVAGFNIEDELRKKMDINHKRGTRGRKK